MLPVILSATQQKHLVKVQYKPVKSLKLNRALQIEILGSNTSLLLLYSFLKFLLLLLTEKGIRFQLVELLINGSALGQVVS